MSRGSRSDLVAEIHNRARRRKQRSVIVAVAVLMLLVACGVVAKLLWDRYRVEGHVQAAKNHVIRGSEAALQQAIDRLDEALEIDPDHDDSLALLAWSHAQRTLDFGADRGPADEAISKAQSVAADHDTVVLATAVLELHDGNVAAAEARVGNVEAKESTAAHQKALLEGLLALSRPHETERVAAVLRTIGPLIDDPAHETPLRRLAASLQFRTGDVEGAIERIDTARKHDDTDLGLAVDEAWFHGLVHDSPTGVIRTTDRLLGAPDALSPRDRARAHGARAAAALHQGDRHVAFQHLERGFATLPTWDWDSRDRMLELLLSTGETDRVRAVLTGTSPPGHAAAIYEAWLALADGDLASALARTAELPQDHPQVAYLQALALVEQRRFAEAEPWLDRAQALCPRRVELMVAKSRADAHTHDPILASQRLAELAELHPHAPRVWTALGEARLLMFSKKAAEKSSKRKRSPEKDVLEPLETAIERESHPAEAALLLGQLEREAAIHQRPRTAQALRWYERAADANPHFPRYRRELALHLEQLGQLARAEQILETVVDDELAGPESALALVRVVLHRGSPTEEIKKKISRWIELAQARGAADHDIERERARVELAIGTPDDLASARRRLERLIPAHPDDVGARVIYLRTLRAQGDLEAAIENAKVGIRRLWRGGNGPLYVQWALVERERRHDRVAAKVARDGWDRMGEGDVTVHDLLEGAQLVTDLWLAIRQDAVARTIAREATERAPIHPEAWMLRARIEMATGAAEAGCAHATKATTMPSAGPDAYALAGECLAKTGRVEDARAAYEQAVALAGASPVAKTYRKAMKNL